MEWNEETISQLQELWRQGLSTAEIGRQLGITKNAVVGKAHRLALPPRPSPIRKAAARVAVEAAPVEAKPARPAAASAPVAADIAAVPRAPQIVAPPVAEPAAAPRDEAPPAPDVARVVSLLAHRAPDAGASADETPEVAATPRASVPRPALRSVPAEPRRRGPSCCWPLGDPGTPGFHFCGAEPLSGKPYCAEHAAVAYVKLRDRRDSVA